MLRVATIILFLLISSAVAAAQAHQHGSSPSGDGNFNPYVASDGRGGFYLAYIHRANGSSNVMLRHSTDGKVFSDSPDRLYSNNVDARLTLPATCSGMPPALSSNSPNGSPAARKARSSTPRA